VGTLVKISDAAVEPITLLQAKNFLRVDADATDDDDLIGLLIRAAREYAENFCRASFGSNESWKMTLDHFPSSIYRGGDYECTLDFVLWPSEFEYRMALPRRFAIEIPSGPVQSITSVKYLDGSGDQQTLDPDGYLLIADDDGPGYLYPKYGTYWPATRYTAGAIEINFVTGKDCPQGVLLGMQQMIAHWYVNREAEVMVSGVTPQDVPLTAKMLMWPFRNLELA
jgi:uncharacterized phiE125 gp8 family phage protein